MNQQGSPMTLEEVRQHRAVLDRMRVASIKELALDLIATIEQLAPAQAVADAVEKVYSFGLDVTTPESVAASAAFERCLAEYRQARRQA